MGFFYSSEPIFGYPLRTLLNDHKTQLIFREDPSYTVYWPSLEAHISFSFSWSGVLFIFSLFFFSYWCLPALFIFHLLISIIRWWCIATGYGRKADLRSSGTEYGSISLHFFQGFYALQRAVFVLLLFFSVFQFFKGKKLFKWIFCYHISMSFPGYTTGIIVFFSASMVEHCFKVIAWSLEIIQICMSTLTFSQPISSWYSPPAWTVSQT